MDGITKHIDQGALRSALLICEGSTLDEYITRHEYMERIGRSDDKMHSLDRRLSKVEELGEKLSEMAITMQGMLVTLQNMQQEQAEQGKRLQKIEQEPGDTWKKVKWTIIACVITAVVGFLFGKGGL